MILESESDVIRKKQYMNKDELVEVVIPENIRGIENWAFAYCVNLKKVHIPKSVAFIGKDIFVGCDNLESVHVYENIEQSEDIVSFDDKTDEMLCKLTAYNMKYFDYSGNNVFDNYGTSLYLEKLDANMSAFIKESDDVGFKPFLAGGEEDYADIEKEKNEYIYKRQILKCKMILDRLIYESVNKSKNINKKINERVTGKIDEIFPQIDFKIYLEKMTKSNLISKYPLLDCLLMYDDFLNDAFNVCKKANVFDGCNLSQLIDYLPDECVELKALFMKEASVFLDNVWNQFDII